MKAIGFISLLGYLICWAACAGNFKSVKSKYAKWITFLSTLGSVLLGILFAPAHFPYHETLIIINIVLKQVVIGVACCLLRFPIGDYFKGREDEAEVAREEKEASIRAEEKLDALKQGSWEFPYMEFYELCRESNIPEPDGSEFSTSKLQKAVQFILDRHQIPKEFANDFLPHGAQYYEKAKKELLNAAQEQQKRNNTLTRFTPSEDEQIIITAVEKIKSLYGLDKRRHMLSNEIDVIENQIEQLRTEISGDSKRVDIPYRKEKDWAIWGGFANGLAGPGAGIVTALQVQQENQKIREQNLVFAEAGAMLERMKKERINRLYSNISSLKDTQNTLRSQLEKLPLLVVFLSPDCKEIQDSLAIEKEEFTKTESGILSIGIFIASKLPANRKPVAEAVIDGTVHGKVYINGQFAEDVYFVLPRTGLPLDGQSVTVYGFCTTALPVEGNYHVEISNQSNLWIVEK